MDFQTPKHVADYMVKLLCLPRESWILEPTPGDGAIVESLSEYGYHIWIPEDDFWSMEHHKYVGQINYHGIVMNLPFTPMKLGYKFLYECMNLSSNIVALMPWLTIINSQKRTFDIMSFGLKSITHLPRNIFPGSRVQTCILHMKKYWDYPTEFIDYNKESNFNLTNDEK